MAQARGTPQNDDQQKFPEEIGTEAVHEASTKEETQTTENPTTKDDEDDRDPSHKDAQAIVHPSTDEPISHKPHQESTQAENMGSRSDNDGSHEANQELLCPDFLSAIEKGDVGRVEEIISKDEVMKSIAVEYSFPNNTNDKNVTPLMIATVHARKEVAIILLGKGADMNTITLQHHWTALHLAIIYGHADMVNILLENQKRVTISFGRPVVHIRRISGHRDSYGRTPLSIAAQNGHLAITGSLLRSEADVDGTHRIREPRPLHYAIENNRYKIAELLLKHNASVGKRDSSGKNALHYACQQADRKFAELLIEYGADKTHVLNASNNHGCSPLQLAAGRGHDSVVDLLLTQKNIDLKHRDSDGNTALSEAASHQKYTVMIKFLLHETYMPKNPILSRAFLAKDPEPKRISKAAKEGLENVYKKSSDLEAITFWAVVNGDIELMDDCFRKDKNLLSWKQYNMTWQHIAAQYGHSELIRNLLAKDFSVDDVADDGLTVLHFAVESGNLPAVAIALTTLNSNRAPENDSIQMKLLQVVRRLVRRSGKAEKESPFSLAVKGKRHHIEEFFWKVVIAAVGHVKWSEQNFWIDAGNVKDVRQILAVAAQVDRPGKEENFQKLLKAMLGSGTYNSREITGALHLAVYHQQVVPIWWLLSNGGHLRKEERETALEILGQQQKGPRTDMIRKLLHNPPPVIDHSANPFDDYLVEWKNDTPTNSNVNFEGTIYDFYHTEDKTRQIDLQYEQDNLDNIIYRKGPEAIMSDARKGDYRDLTVLESAIEKVDHESEPASPIESQPATGDTETSETNGKKRSKDRNLAFRWVHVPVNDMDLIKDLVTRLYVDKEKTNKELRHLANFLDRSWTETAAGGRKKFMKPQCLHHIEKLRSEVTDPSQNMNNKSSPEAQGGHDDLKCKKQNLPNASRDKDKPLDADPSVSERKSNAASDFAGNTKLMARHWDYVALYMPFLSVWDRQPSTKGVADTTEQKKDSIIDKDSTDSPSEFRSFLESLLQEAGVREERERIVHSRITLDQFYYATISNTENRDKDQVLSRYLRDEKKKASERSGVKEETTERQDEGEKDETDESILAVDQLWLWVIDKKTIITAAADSSKRIDDFVFDDFVDSLVGERDGAFDQPISASAILELILDAATRLFVERQISLPKAKNENRTVQKGVLDVFDESIRDVADREINLFNEFKDSLAREETEKETQRERSKRKNDSKGGHCPNDNNQPQTNSIFKETNLLREIKDICDELNILKTLVEAQHAVWKQAFGIDKLENGPHFKYEHSCTPATVGTKLGYMIHDAQEVQKSIYTLLDLRQKQASLKEAEFGRLQSEATAHQSMETTHQSEQMMKQSKTVMVFTVVTIVFLPLSFLTSLFALNISNFPHRGDDVEYQGWWIFPILFGTAAAVSLPCMIFAFKVNEIEYFWNNPKRFKESLKQSTKPWLLNRKSPGDEEKGNLSDDSETKSGHSKAL